MSIRSIIISGILLIVVFSCENKKREKGSGVPTYYTESNLAEFYGFETNCDFYFRIEQDTATSVSYKIDDNLLPYVSTVVNNGILYIERVDGKILLSELEEGIEVTIKTPHLNRIVSKYGGEIYVPELNADVLDVVSKEDAMIVINQLDSRSAYFSSEGDGGIYILDILGDTVIADLTYSGRIELTGIATYSEYYNDGTGVIVADNLDVDVCDATINTTGEISVNALDELYGYFNGPGNIYYRSFPKTRLLGTGQGMGDFRPLSECPFLYSTIYYRK